jgi:RNA polymerase sigma-70 factor (ECF subfamily)
MELNDKEFSDKAKDDFNLIDLAVAGGKESERAFATLMDRYRKPVYHTMLKMVRNVDDAEDLTIEAFAKAFRNLPRFKKEYTFSTWLFRIATNNCIDFIRKKKIDTMSISSAINHDDADPLHIEIKDMNRTPQEEAIQQQKADMVREFVKLLPPKYQRLVRLRYFDELSYEEIAEEIEAPLGTVKAQLHRARELLLDLVKDSRDLI